MERRETREAGPIDVTAPAGVTGPLVLYLRPETASQIGRAGCRRDGGAW